jgi:uncharacterized protein YlxW (UPF0749 family)
VAVVVNRRALRKYREFVGALETVWLVLDDAQRLADKVTAESRTSWRAATGPELRGLVRNTQEHVDALQTRARKYEAELVSREWRV